MPNPGEPELGGRGDAPPLRQQPYSISSPPKKSGSAPAQPLSRFCSTAYQNARLLHRAFVVEAVLIVLDDGGDRLQRELTLGVLDHVLQVEILDRDVVVAVFERPAQRLEVGLLHLGL